METFFENLNYQSETKKSEKNPELVSILEGIDSETLGIKTLTKNYKLVIPDYIFKPDNRTEVMQTGLFKTNLDNKRVCEIGIGSGINLLEILNRYNPEAVYGFDYEGRAAPVSNLNITQNLDSTKYKGKLNLFDRSFNLLEGTEEIFNDQHIDVLYGCLPQIPQVVGKQQEQDHISHFYDKELYKSNYHHLGLGLIEELLRQIQTKNILNPEGSVVLNMSGRVGKQIIINLFIQHGFFPHIIHQKIVSQHQETSLESLANIEKEYNTTFEFFADEIGEKNITAREAEEKRLAGEGVFHYIYVVEGKPTTKPN